MYHRMSTTYIVCHKPKYASESASEWEHYERYQGSLTADVQEYKREQSASFRQSESLSFADKVTARTFSRILSYGKDCISIVRR